MPERYESLSRFAGTHLPRTSGVADAGAAVGVLVCMDSFTQDGTIPIIHDKYELFGVAAFIMGGVALRIYERFFSE